jgi:DNA-binding transcriptional MerR regulator
VEKNDMASVMTLGDVARLVGVDVWQVRRLYERGLLPPAARVGGKRVVSAAELPRVRRALTEAGYLRSEEPAPAA